jgi:ABC-type dipeptide/oligopeptide/nickel transport system permease component
MSHQPEHPLRRIADGVVRLIMVFLAAGLCSFLTIYRPVLRTIYDGLEGYFGFVGGIGRAWSVAAPFVLADYGNSLLALGTALVWACAIGLPAGFLVGTRPTSLPGMLVRLGSSFGAMMPAFLLAMAIMVFFVLVVLPATGIRFILLSSLESTLDPRRLLPVALTLTARPLAHITAVTAAAVQETLAADYIRTARAKGLAQWAILTRHVLPNIAVPLIGAVPTMLLFGLGSLPIIEFIFSWPGIGQELLYRVVASPEADAGGASLVGFLFAAMGLTYALVALVCESTARALERR